MPSTGIPSSSSSGSSRGAPSAYTEAGPPERISPFGLRRRTSSTPDVVRQQLAEHAALAHAAGDQLRVLAAVVEDHDLVGRDRPLERELLDRLLGGERGAVALRDDFRGVHSPPTSAGTGLDDCTAPPRAPMPIAWSRCSDLPSVWSAGATISSARLNSAMSW